MSECSVLKTQCPKLQLTVLGFEDESFYWLSGLLDADMETAPPADQAMEKVKKRYRKKKTKLEEAFPSYLQVTRTYRQACMSCSTVI